MYNDIEDEEFNTLISQLAGQAQPSSEVGTPAAQSQSVYTPPPAAADPMYQQKVGKREFGFGDIAMLGGILASLATKKPGIAGALAGQYGGAVMQDSARRDAQNADIERFNAKLASENDPLDRWQKEQAAKLGAANVEARNAETEVQRSREDRMARLAADEADPESPLNQAKLTYQQKLADIELNQRKALGEASTAEKIRVLAEAGKYKGGRGAGKGSAAPKPVSATKELAEYKARAELERLQSGDAPQAGMTAAQQAAKEKRDALRVPFDGYVVADDALWDATVLTPNIREKLRASDAQLATADDALREMADIRKQYGGESAMFGDAEAVGRYNTAKSKLSAAIGEIKNIGVVSPTEMAVINDENIPTLDKSPRDMLNKAFGDNKLGLLEGTRKGIQAARYNTAKRYGLAPDTSAGAGKQTAPSSGTVTMVSPSGKQGTVSQDQVEALKAKGFKVIQ